MTFTFKSTIFNSNSNRVYLILKLLLWFIMSLLFVVPLLTFNHISNIVLNHDNLTLADKHTHSLSHTHAQLLTLILALSLTAERLMTLGGGTGESSRYNMLDEIQAFSIPRAC